MQQSANNRTYTRGANNSPSPWLHEYIIGVIHPIANSSISNSLLTSLKLFQ